MMIYRITVPFSRGEAVVKLAVMIVLAMLVRSIDSPFHSDSLSGLVAR